MKSVIFILVFVVGIHGYVIEREDMHQDILAKFDHLHSKTSNNGQSVAVEQLIQRLIPTQAKKFTISVDKLYFNSSTMDVFEYQSTSGGDIIVRGTSGVAAAAGFYHYLKYLCNSHISWSGDQLAVPDNLPEVDEPVRKSFLDRFRYYQNVCTVSYSMAFWNWTRWQKEIDWMAMNGINLPLAFTGQEAIWQIVYKKLGLTQKELDEHFAGPAFLAWQRMGNIYKWGGPLPVSWYPQQLDLQQKILTRMRSLGMIPVLPGFAGHIPEALVKRLYPEANYYRLGGWNGFPKTYDTFLLDPRDPLFQTVGALFIKTQEKLYNGTDHLYNADVFNEMTPPVLTPQFMSNISKLIYQSMKFTDPKAVWLMQAWQFLQGYWNPELEKAWFDAVPIGGLILLDLASEIDPIYKETKGYFGHPFIWSMIENFGGNTRLYGKITDVMKDVVTARSTYKNLMIGIGTSPEGIEQNDINFDIMYEMAWRVVPANLTRWTKLYITRRYGKIVPQVEDAWNILIGSIYNSHGNFQNGGLKGRGRVPVMRPYVTNKLPSIMWYDPKQIYETWKMMVEGSNQMPKTDTFRYDLVHLGTQVLEDISLVMYKEMINGYNNKSSSDVMKYGFQLTTLLADMNILLSTDPFSLLGNWIEAAKAFGVNGSEKQLLEFNARNQLTLWGPSGEIHDYANKHWAGLVKTYYLKRWVIFTGYLLECTAKGDEFNVTKFNNMLLEFEIQWNKDRTIFQTVPEGDAYEISSALVQKYGGFLQKHKEISNEVWSEARRLTASNNFSLFAMHQPI